MKSRIRTYPWYPAPAFLGTGLLLGLILALLGVTMALTAGNIDATNKWAWSANAGWINFASDNGGVTVYSDHLEGYAWCENIGWIRLGTHEGGGAHTYTNTDATDYGVNRDLDGNLFGYAWGTNVGWINFAPTNGGVTINPVTGDWAGYAWGENVGWISFKGTGYGVALNTYALTVSKAGTGGGTVALNPAGGVYTPGTVVTLTATPLISSTFTGWSGEVSTMMNPVTLTVNVAKNVTATFTLNTYAITPTVVGTGGVIMPNTPQTVSYGACQTFTLTANTDYHTLDVGVDGASVGAASAYTFTNVTANHTITAAFAENASVTPLADVTISGPTAGMTNTDYSFVATISPVTATTPITYAWSPAPDSGQGTSAARYTWSTTGTQAITITATNPANTVTETHVIAISTPPPGVTPLTGVTISGPTTGTVNMASSFVATISPVMATTPITYTWSPAPNSGQGTLAATYSWTTSGVKTIMVIAQNAGSTVNNTHVITISAPPPSAGDAYEPDNTCAQAKSILTDGTVQFHTFHAAGDVDWGSFQAISGTTYLVEARTPADSLADVVLEVHDTCDHYIDGQNFGYTPDVRLQFKAPTDGIYHLRLNNNNLDQSGPDVSYQLSVRSLSSAVTPGALILVAGRLRYNDMLQGNIYNVTNAVYRLFRANGYPEDRIYYLANDPQDVDNDGSTEVRAQANGEHLRQAITEWAVDKVGADRALTVYLMDHGGYDTLFLNGRAETLAPDDLDEWLDTLESKAPGLKVNVIVEACHSGSFIDLMKSVSKPGRAVMTSTSPDAVAYATERGAMFSDAFVSALERGASVYGGFEESQSILRVAHPDQTPWLDDDGDGRPNEPEDGLESAHRGFAYAGTFPEEKWPPYVVWAEVVNVKDGKGTLRAKVEDDKGVLSVWAVVYKPSYQPPLPTGEEIIQENLPTVTLLDQDGDKVYTALYESLTEIGEYRIVIYAVDTQSLQGRPKAVQVRTGWSVYLPVVMRSLP